MGHRPDRSNPQRLPGVRLAAFTVTSLVVGQMPTLLTAGLAVQIQRDLGFGTAALGLAIGASLAASMLGSVPLGRVADRIGWASGMRRAAILGAACSGAIAALAASWGQLALILVVAGFAKSIGHPSESLALVVEAPRRHQGLFFGIKQAGAPLAAMLAGFSVPALALTFGWRSAFWTATGLAVVLATALPRRRLPARGPHASATGRPVHVRSLLVLATAGGMGVAVANSLASFLTTYGVATGFDEGEAGLVLALGSASGVLIRVVVGWLADRRSLGLGSVSALLLAGCVGILLIAAGSATLTVVGSVIAFGAGWGWAGLFNLAVVQRNPLAPALATGYSQAGIYAGAGLGPVAFGLIAEHIGFGAAWLFLGVVSAAAAALMRIGDTLSKRATTLQVPE